ncbi:MAG: Smr/MutS family protein [Thermodesulfobacteriota bacterium]
MTEEAPPREPPPHRLPVEDFIDLHAFSPRDVVSVVEEYLEEAASKGFREVRLIHGKGTGVQRAAVRAALSRHPRVESFSDAPPEAGGWGATRVILRKPATGGSEPAS